MPRGTHPNSLANLKRLRKDVSGEAMIAQRKIQAAGGKATAEAYAKKRNFQEVCKALLDAVDEETGMTFREAITATAVKQALKGDKAAREWLGLYAGEKPEEKHDDAIDKLAILMGVANGRVGS